MRRGGICVVRRFSAGSASISVAEYEAAGNGHCELAIGLMDGSLPSHPSILIAGTLLCGTVSLLVPVLGALVMLVDSVANITAIRRQHKPGWLARLYCERVSPLVHIPRRRQALRSTLVVLLVFAPAFPRLEMNGWAPEAPRVLGKILRIVSSVKFIGDGPAPVVSAEKAASDDSASRIVDGEIQGWTDSLPNVNRTCNGRVLVGFESAG